MSPRVRYVVTTLALVAVAVVWNVLDRPAPPRPARAPSPTRAAATPAKPVPPPTAADLLAGARTLELSAEQRARLDALAVRWARDAAPLEAEVKATSDEFARFMTEAEKTGRVRLDEVSARSREVQERSAALRERRARHGEEAIGVLTERQRARLAADNGIPGGGR